MNYLEHKDQKLILIGSSTGGPSHIQKILRALPSSFNAIIVIAQHMGDEYLESFASRLNSEASMNVQLAKHNQSLYPSNAYICTKISELFLDGTIKISITESAKPHYNPDINRLFHSATKIVSKVETVAIILTGIGEDGADGMSELFKCGASTVAESKESAIVYGMPMRAAEVVKEIEILSLNEIIEKIKRFGE